MKIDEVFDQNQPGSDELRGEEERASLAYREKLMRVNMLLQEIGELLVDHRYQQQNYPQSWGHAGDLDHVIDQLRQVHDFLLRDRN